MQVVAYIDWDAPVPIAAALKELSEALLRFDEVRRLKLAVTDMELAEFAAKKLLEGWKRDYPTRAEERLFETALAVIFTRPYIDSSGAAVSKKYRPRGTNDGELLQYLEDLRNEIHAHAGHTERRTIIETGSLMGFEGELILGESYAFLSKDRLNAIIDLSTRQAKRLKAASDELLERLRADLFPES